MVDNLALAIAHIMLGYFAWRAYLMDESPVKSALRRGRNMMRGNRRGPSQQSNGARPHA